VFSCRASFFVFFCKTHTALSEEVASFSKYSRGLKFFSPNIFLTISDQALQLLGTVVVKNVALMAQSVITAFTFDFSEADLPQFQNFYQGAIWHSFFLKLPITAITEEWHNFRSTLIAVISTGRKFFQEACITTLYYIPSFFTFSTQATRRKLRISWCSEFHDVNHIVKDSFARNEISALCSFRSIRIIFFFVLATQRHCCLHKTFLLHYYVPPLQTFLGQRNLFVLLHLSNSFISLLRTFMNCRSVKKHWKQQPGYSVNMAR